MQFSEQLAQQVAKAHNVPDRTVATWKNRGKIPNKYFAPDGSISDPDRILTEQETYHLVRWINDTNNTLNLSAFRAISAQQFADFSRGKGRIGHRQYVGFKTELTDLKNAAGPVFRAKTFAAKVTTLRIFLRDPRIKPFKLGHKYTIECLTTQNTDPQVDEVKQVIIQIGLLLQTLNL